MHCRFKRFSPQGLGSLELLSIFCTMSIKVRFLFSATLFWSGEPIIVHWATIPFFLKKLCKWTRCLSILSVSTIILSISISLHNFNLFSSLFLYFGLKNFEGIYYWEKCPKRSFLIYFLFYFNLRKYSFLI